MRTGWTFVAIGVAAVAATVAAGCGGDGGGSSSFEPAVEFSVGDVPVGVAIGDLNADGVNDVVVANRGSDDVSILINTTVADQDGPSFEPSVEFGVAAEPFAVLLVDLNGDDRPDVVVPGSEAGAVTVMINTTEAGASVPTFSAVDVPVGGMPVYVDAADFDLDGKIDLAVANRSSDDVTIVFNLTPAGATAPVLAVAPRIPVGDVPRFLVAGDLAGDDRGDFAVMTEQEDDVTVHVNVTEETDPELVFAEGVVLDTFLVPSTFVAGRFGGDDKIDLAVATGDTNTVSVFVNVSTGGAALFAASGDVSTGRGPYTIAAGDLDGDGLDDLAVANFIDSSITVLTNRTPSTSEVAVFDSEEVDTGDGPFSLAIGDLDGDGKGDLAVAANSVNRVAIHLQR